MGILPVAATLFVLVVAHGAYGSRSHPTANEVTQKFHAPINETNSIRGLIDHVSPHQDSSGANIVYFAYHGAATAANGYYGFIGTMDVYGFPLAQGQGSAAAVWISDEGDGAASSLKNIMIGWDVLPDLYGDSKTHFYTKWTNDGFQSSGCLNMKCNGFQPEKGAAITPGDVIDHVSSPKGAKRNLNLKIIKATGLCTAASTESLNSSAVSLDRSSPEPSPTKQSALMFGGVVSAPITKPTPMGSGYLPTDVRSAASISNIQLVDQNGRAWPVTGDLLKLETYRNAYAVSPIVNGKFSYGVLRNQQWYCYGTS
ncbi:hypothetical protein C2845_PM09G22170 [Panicum miliaceum]|uniref:Neprosin PEP catalytic domain-containing protein n=1 Tax=Panicum miliaceum TaxID=4540 RepID=A0A3L6RY34_PANMI|nr:hypothetical protein C2845_PM09G22170 [Panicum miliaceum]